MDTSGGAADRKRAPISCLDKGATVEEVSNAEEEDEEEKALARVTTGKRKQIVLEGEPDESDSGQPGQPQMIDFTVEPRGKDAEVEKRDKKKKKKKKTRVRGR